jgi:tellurite resistance protein
VGTAAVPASYFAIVVGLAGLGGAWRHAAQAWGLPRVVGEVLMLCAAIAWLLLIALYAFKWTHAREEALKELEHPVQCCFVGLIGVATMLLALAALAYSRPAAQILIAFGAIFTIVFALWRTGILWQGGRDPAATTPVLYLPTVAGLFVTATAAAALGHGDWGQLAFGADSLPGSRSNPCSCIGCTPWPACPRHCAQPSASSSPRQWSGQSPI